MDLAAPYRVDQRDLSALSHDNISLSEGPYTDVVTNETNHVFVTMVIFPSKFYYFTVGNNILHKCLLFDL